MNADKLLNEIAINISWVTVTLVLVCYVLGMDPSRADTPTVPISISKILVGSCAKNISTQRSGNVYRVSCLSHTGATRKFTFRVDDDGGLYLENKQ